jgi:DNA (cytosine-5)-methyltransferase 1
MTAGSLFAGIGGFDLGFERAGFDVRWQVEINAYCRAVLRKHWPDARRYADVRRVGAANLETVDVICGGFPCQDVASNGTKRGLDGAKSGLFYEMVRVVRELRPRYVVLENVADLLVRGMGTVLGELAAIGYDAEWECLPAAVFGLPQPRWRVFIVAYPGSVRREAGHEWLQVRPFSFGRIDHDRLAQAEHAAQESIAAACRADDGLSGGMDRVAACGNAIVPQIAQWIAERIKEAEAMRAA